MLSCYLPQVSLLLLLKSMHDAFRSMNLTVDKISRLAHVLRSCLLISDCVKTAERVMVNSQFFVSLLVNVAAQQIVQVVSFLQKWDKLLALFHFDLGVVASSAQ